MSPGPSEGPHQLIVVSGRAQNSTQMNPSQLYSKSGSEEEKKNHRVRVFMSVLWDRMIFYIYIFVFFFRATWKIKGKGRFFLSAFFLVMVLRWLIFSVAKCFSNNEHRLPWCYIFIFIENGYRLDHC